MRGAGGRVQERALGGTRGSHEPDAPAGPTDRRSAQRCCGRGSGRGDPGPGALRSGGPGPDDLELSDLGLRRGCHGRRMNGLDGRHDRRAAGGRSWPGGRHGRGEPGGHRGCCGPDGRCGRCGRTSVARGRHGRSNGPDERRGQMSGPDGRRERHGRRTNGLGGRHRREVRGHRGSGTSGHPAQGGHRSVATDDRRRTSESGGRCGRCGQTNGRDDRCGRTNELGGRCGHCGRTNAARGRHDRSNEPDEHRGQTSGPDDRCGHCDRMTEQADRWNAPGAHPDQTSEGRGRHGRTTESDDRCGHSTEPAARYGSTNCGHTRGARRGRRVNPSGRRGWRAHPVTSGASAPRRRLLPGGGRGGRRCGRPACRQGRAVSALTEIWNRTWA